MINSCQKRVGVESSFNPIPITIDIPDNFPPIEHPSDNPLTQQGVNLGRHLFWDKKLSGDNTISCANCHSPQHAFSDPNTFSTGIYCLASFHSCFKHSGMAYHIWISKIKADKIR